MTYDALPPLRHIIEKYHLDARKSLGQNFLLDLNLTAKIARLGLGVSGHTGKPEIDTCLPVLEIGPGPGGLTRALLKEGTQRVVAIEKDQRCLSALKEIQEIYADRLTIIEGDALDAQLALPLSEQFRVVANLPYNIGTELLVRWLCAPAWPPAWKNLTLMFQKEVAQRIVAQPGTKAYGRLSVLAQWRSKADIVLEVGPRAFTPPPKISSAVVHICPLDKPVVNAELKYLEQITQAAFGQRRKMLRQSIKIFGPPVEALLEHTHVKPTDRPEILSVQDFCQIAQNLSRLLQT